MYKGLARLVGMDIVGKAQTLAEQIDVLEQNWNDYDFFFLHYKYTDSTGEDGNFAAKVKRIEELDAVDPAHHRAQARRADRHRRPQHAELAQEPQLASGADAAGLRLLPAAMRCSAFGESESIRGGLGQFEAKYLMPLALANAGRLGKYRGVTRGRGLEIGGRSRVVLIKGKRRLLLD